MRIGEGVGRTTVGATFLFFLLLMPLAARGGAISWIGIGGGRWDDEHVWNPDRQPLTGDAVSLTSSDAANREIYYAANSLDPSRVLASLTVNATGSGTMTFVQAGDLLSVSTDETVGSTGKGTYNQTGGTNTMAGNLFVGKSTGSKGTYNLSETGSLSAKNEYIGSSGSGTFHQTGGTNEVTGSLYLGTSSGGRGTYNLSNEGALSFTSATGYERIGSYGTGTFNQEGGTHAASYLEVGSFGGSTGYYNLSDGDLSAISETIGNVGTGTFTQTGGTNTVTGKTALQSFILGSSSTGVGTYYLSKTGALSAVNEYVGASGLGTFDQSGGTNTMTGSLYVGNNGTATGTYDLSDKGILSAKDEYIGVSGFGTFTQTGGTNTMTGSLTVGGAATGRGTYDLSDGTLSATSSETIGSFGTGAFTQTGGTNTTRFLYLGVQSSGTGTYNLGNTEDSSLGALSADSVTIGSSGTGTFNQSGGTNEVADMLALGSNATGRGTYNLSDGSLSAKRATIGYSGAGTFSQSGGTNEMTGALTLGSAAGGSGTYNLSDGALSANSETIGYSGAGTFTQIAGTNITNTLTIKGDATNPTASGVYSLEGGTLTAGTIVNNDRFHYSGGTLNGNVSNNAGATFSLSGSDTRTVNGSVTNNGTVKVAGTADGTTAVFTGTFTNNGVLNSDPARLEFHDDFIVGADGSIHASMGDEYVLYQDFVIQNAGTTGWTTAGANLIFTGSGTHQFSFLDGLDLTWNGLFLENGADVSFSATGALYAGLLDGLDVEGRNILNLSAVAGFTLFYDPVLNSELSGVYQLVGGGTLSPVPLPGAALLGALGLGVAGWRLRRRGA